MKRYEDLVRQLKGVSPNIDYQQMKLNIERRSAQKPFFLPTQFGLTLSSVLVIIILSFTLYLNLQQDSADLGLNYILDQDKINGNVVMSYVFDD